MLKSEQVKLIESVEKHSREAGFKVYIVGGFIRDSLLNLEQIDQDIDFIVDGDASVFAEFCQQKFGGQLKIFKDFLTAKIVNPSEFKEIKEIDFASAREEVYPTPGKLPSVKIGTIAQDFRRRDFTINAMAADLSGFLALLNHNNLDRQELKNILIDPFQGKADLEQRSIKILHDQSFIDDPSRIFRAFRYAGRLAFKIEANTLVKISEALAQGALSTISINRKLNEIKKIIADPNAYDIFRLMKDSQLLEELNFFHYGYADTLLQKIKVLGILNLNAQLKYEVLLRLMLFSFFAEQQDSDMLREQAQSFFTALGFGRKQIQKYFKDTSNCSGQNPDNLSDEALVFNYLIQEPENSEFRKSMVDKKFL